CERSLPPIETTMMSAEAARERTLALLTRSRSSDDSAPLTDRLAISAGPRFFITSSTSPANPRPDSSPVPRARESPSTSRRRRAEDFTAGRGACGGGGGAPMGSPSAPRRASQNPAAKRSVAAAATTAGTRQSQKREVKGISAERVSRIEGKASDSL